MKISAAFLYFLLIVACGSEKKNVYRGSTPAANIIRLFLEIPLSDSVDFIRWKLTLIDNQYQLECNYGIGKPNTNGFINGGKKIGLNGAVRKVKDYYELQHRGNILKLTKLNADILHILNTDNSLLVGNGAWSYTLNNITPLSTDQINITAKQTVLKDSMAFEGRTPCHVPGIIGTGVECYKLKWYIVLYANVEKNEPGNYKIYGTLWRKDDARTGNWKIIAGKKGNIIYQLADGKGNGFLYLLKLDEHILMFTDAKGKLLVGDEDFSYTLNARR